MAVLRALEMPESGMEKERTEKKKENYWVAEKDTCRVGRPALLCDHGTVAELRALEMPESGMERVRNENYWVSEKRHL